jgi:hypothetical protein
MADLEQVKIILQTILPTSAMAAVLLENLDTNNTGWDDDGAKAVQQFNESIKALIASFPESATARGYAQTKVYCDNVLNQMRAIADGETPRPQKLTALQLLRDSLDDSDKVWQAKKGKDADYLATARTKANQIIAAV